MPKALAFDAKLLLVLEHFAQCVDFVDLKAKEVLAVQPKNVPAIINLGLLYLADKKLPLAQLMFTKALGYQEKNARAHNNMGLTFYEMELVKDGKVAVAEIPMRNAMNEILRDDYLEDGLRGVTRWNKVLEEAGLSDRLTMPHRRFHRRRRCG